MAKGFKADEEVEILLNGQWLPARVRIVHPAVEEVNKPETYTVRVEGGVVVPSVGAESLAKPGKGKDGESIQTSGHVNQTTDVSNVSATEAGVAPEDSEPAQELASDETEPEAPAEEVAPVAPEADETKVEIKVADEAPSEAPAEEGK